MSTKPQDKKPATGSAAQDKPKTDAPKDKKPVESKEAPKAQTDKSIVDKKSLTDAQPKTNTQSKPEDRPKTDTTKEPKENDKSEQKPRESRDGDRTRDGEKRDQKPRDGERRDQKPRDGDTKDQKPRDGERRDQKPRDGDRPRDGDTKDQKPRDFRDAKEGNRRDQRSSEGDKGEWTQKDKKPREEGEGRDRDRDGKPRSERKQREDRDGDSEWRDKREKGEKLERGDRKDRGERGDRERRPRTEGGEERPRRERKEKPKREWDPNWRDKIVVTADTVVEAAPEPVPKPDKEKLEKDIEFCDNKISEYKKQLDILFKKRDDWRVKQREDRDKAKMVRIAEWDKQDKEREDHKHIYGDHKIIKAQFDEINGRKKKVDAELDIVSAKITEVERKFPTKSIMSANDVMDQIKQLENRQMNEKLTGNEEKKIIAEIYALKKSIPSSSEATALFDEKKEIIARRKKILNEIDPVYKKLKALSDQIDSIKKAREDEIAKKEGRDPKDTKHDVKGSKGGKKEGDKPEHTGDATEGDKKEDKRSFKERRAAGEKLVDDSPFAKEIEQMFEYKNGMFKKKDTLRENFDAQWDKYHEAKEKAMKIDYIKRQLEHLKNIEGIKEEKARRERKALIQEYIEKNTPKEDASSAYYEDLCRIP